MGIWVNWYLYVYTFAQKTVPDKHFLKFVFHSSPSKSGHHFRKQSVSKIEVRKKITKNGLQRDILKRKHTNHKDSDDF